MSIRNLYHLQPLVRGLLSSLDYLADMLESGFSHDDTSQTVVTCSSGFSAVLSSVDKLAPAHPVRSFDSELALLQKVHFLQLDLTSDTLLASCSGHFQAFHHVLVGQTVRKRRSLKCRILLSTFPLH